MIRAVAIALATVALCACGDMAMGDLSYGTRNALSGPQFTPVRDNLSALPWEDRLKQVDLSCTPAPMPCVKIRAVMISHNFGVRVCVAHPIDPATGREISQRWLNCLEA